MKTRAGAGWIGFPEAIYIERGRREPWGRPLPEGATLWGPARPAFLPRASSPFIAPGRQARELRRVDWKGWREKSLGTPPFPPAAEGAPRCEDQRTKGQGEVRTCPQVYLALSQRGSCSSRSLSPLRLTSPRQVRHARPEGAPLTALYTYKGLDSLHFQTCPFHPLCPTHPPALRLEKGTSSEGRHASPCSSGSRDGMVVLANFSLRMWHHDKVSDPSQV